MKEIQKQKVKGEKKRRINKKGARVKDCMFHGVLDSSF